MLAPDALVLAMPVSVSPLTPLTRGPACWGGGGSVEGLSPLACDRACDCVCVCVCVYVCGWLVPGWVDTVSVDGMGWTARS